MCKELCIKMVLTYFPLSKEKKNPKNIISTKFQLLSYFSYKVFLRLQNLKTLSLSLKSNPDVLKNFWKIPKLRVNVT